MENYNETSKRRGHELKPSPEYDLNQLEVLQHSLFFERPRDPVAVIQAGGRGTRLKPYTLLLPKPLMPIGDLPVIEVLIKWLRRWGVKKTFITIGYLGNLIRSLCGDGGQWDVEIVYSEEPEPLGTIGPLKLLKDQLTETFLSVNGDLITDLNLYDFTAYHRKQGGLLTVAATEKNISTELGVIEVHNGRMVSFQEKPILTLEASAGIYCMEPSLLDLIPGGVPFGFDTLVETMLHNNLPIYVYKHSGLWFDIGREEDFKRAQEDFLDGFRSAVLGC